jgi:hypothetical protein
VFDAGGGTGSWTVSVAPQSQTRGVSIDVPSTVTVTPGGNVSLPVVVNAPANAATGEDYGFIVLSGNGVNRRIPYSFLVERPALSNAPVTPLKKLQTGTTAKGTNRVSAYCCPSAPFGPAPNYVGQPMNENGDEHLYSVEINRPIVNFGVSVLLEGGGALVDPFVLGSKDENDVQGYAGIPTDVNQLTFDSNIDVGAAGAQFPRQQTFYVSVDSRADPYTGKPQNGRYTLNAWVDDLLPPAVRILTTRVTEGRPLIIAEVADSQSGVDPLSLAIGYRRVLVGASDYSPLTGLAVFGLPNAAPKLNRGRTSLTLRASDYQEAKNIDTIGPSILPNTAFDRIKLRVVAGPSLTWVEPPAGVCALKNDRLVVYAASTKKVKDVVFSDGHKRIGVDRTGPAGVYSVPWRTTRLKKGRHELLAEVVDAAGRTYSATHTVRICK